MNVRNKAKKPLHLGMGHFWIGKRDGVNVVMMRNVESLLEIHPEVRVTFFGKLAGNWEEFARSIPNTIEYINIDEFDPDYQIPGLRRKTTSEQKIQDYIWQGTNIMEVLTEKLRPMDMVVVENLGIGINPAVTYAFYLYLQYCQRHHPRKRIFYRAHDFLQQRARNFENLKKFQDTEIPLIPNWHEVIYPNYPNVGYITINRPDIERLIEHGIDRERIAYVPNPVDEHLIVDDNEYVNLRKRLAEQLGLRPDVRFILYPVRCVKRKNIEEAIFLTCLFNKIFNKVSQREIDFYGVTIEEEFHLLVGIKPDSGEDLEYAQAIEKFCREHRLPATIGIGDFVSFEREIDPQTEKITRYSIVDAFNMSDIVITTSYLEGFGFAFIEPWYLGKAVIGRNIQDITQDFQLAGVNLDHLYNVFRINGQDFRSIGYKGKENIGLEKRLEQIPKLENATFVKQVLGANDHSIRAMMHFLIPGKGDAIIQKNRQVVASTYSQKRVAQRLWNVLIGMPLRTSR